MFLAMVLTNARRGEARAVTLSVEGEEPRIDLLMGDGSGQRLVAPPAEVLLKIMESLEAGQTSFSSSVYAATIEQVAVQRSAQGMRAEISQWSIEHT